MKWKFEKGAVLRYELTRTSERRGRQEKLQFGLNLEILDVEAGVATMKVAIDEADPAAAVGKSFELKLRDTGGIVELKGLKDVPGLGDEEMKKLLEVAFPRLSKEAVAEGGIWKSEGTISVHVLGDAPAKSMSKVTAIKNKVVDFQTKTKLEVGEGNGHMEIWDAGAEGRGTWDANAGRLTEYASDIKITAEAHGQAVELIVTTTLKWRPK